METKYNNKGRISSIRTIRTMDVDEVWEPAKTEVNFLALRVTCSRYGAQSGKFFSVSATDPDVITVVRLK